MPDLVEEELEGRDLVLAGPLLLALGHAPTPGPGQASSVTFAASA
jgi:hypothetical protein